MIHLKHILQADQFSKEDLSFIYHLTNQIRRFDKHRDGLLYLKSLLNEKRVMLYFTQVSTRTFLSFQSACYILGMQTLEIRDPSISSEVKGESLEDSIRTFSSYVDLIIMRSAIPGLSKRTAHNLDQTARAIPVINAGSGPDEHPTQAILDMYTLMRSFKGADQIDGKKICFVGDLRRGRTVRSLTQLLCQFDGIEIFFVSPKELSIEEDLKEKLRKSQVNFTQTDDFEAVIRQTDVIYMTRIQDEYEIYKTPSISPPFSLIKDHLSVIKKDCVIMHPFPRRSELDKAIDNDPRAMYWRQERNGMWTRAALIAIIFGVADKVLLPRL